LTLRPGSLLFNRDHVTDDLEISRGDLAAAIHKVERQFLPFGQTFEARTLHLTDVDEHVLPAFVALDETEALLGVEEFDFALAGADHLRRHSAATGGRAARAGETGSRRVA